jgi:hypothetical protein
MTVAAVDGSGSHSRFVRPRHRDASAARGHSLEQELLAVIVSAAAYSASEKLAIAEYSQSLTPAGPQTDAAILIREDRDRPSR